MRSAVFARLLDERRKFERSVRSQEHDVTIFQAATTDFDSKWNLFDERMKLVPGKDLFSALNAYLQETYHVSLSSRAVVDSFTRDEIWPEVCNLVKKLDEARHQATGQDD